MAHQSSNGSGTGSEIKTISQLLSDRSDTYSDRTFLTYGDEDEKTSFEEMNDRANAIGNTLRSNGLSRGDRVAVLCKTPPRAFETLFGTVKGGGVFSQINYEYFGRELAYNINDTAPSFLVMDDRFTDNLNGVKDDLDDLPTVVLLETEDPGEPQDGAFDVIQFQSLLEGERTDPEIEQHWTDDALIMYTSGTTGDSKGCVISHRMALENYTDPQSELFDEGDVWHNPQPTYHFAGTAPIIMTLKTGMRMVAWDRFSVNDFWDRIDRYEATFALLLSVMIDWIEEQPAQPDDHENTLKVSRLQPLPDNYQDICERFGIGFLTAGFAQTETGGSFSGFIHAAQGEHGTPDEYIRGAHPDDIRQRAEDMGLTVVDELPGDSWRQAPQVRRDDSG